MLMQDKSYDSTQLLIYASNYSKQCIPQIWLSVRCKKQTDVTVSIQMQHCVPFTPFVQGPTALHEAAEKCDAAMVQLLLEHGANIKARTKHAYLQPLRRTVHSIPDAALAWIVFGTAVLAVFVLKCCCFWRNCLVLLIRDAMISLCSSALNNCPPALPPT